MKKLSLILLALSTSLVISAAGPVQRPGSDLPHPGTQSVNIINEFSQWSVYGAGNQAKIESPRRDAMRLSLGHVLWGWPYTYQWSGARRQVELNVRRFPVLEASVSEIQRGSYAHLELAVLDGTGQTVKTLRSESLVQPGVIRWNLEKLLEPAVYTVELRLIVGGDNAGCSVTYGYVGTARPIASR